jgi:hypothetical protein
MLNNIQGPTHTAVTPLDLVKCRRQVDPKMYKGNFEAWGLIGRAEGIRGIFTGWAPTFFGYSVSGLSQTLTFKDLTLSRLKERSNMGDMKFSSISTLKLSGRNWHTNIGPLCISPPVPRRNSLQISPFAHLKLSRSVCKLQFPHSQLLHSVEST